MLITKIRQEEQTALVVRARAPLAELGQAAETALQGLVAAVGARRIVTSGAPFTRYLGLTAEGEFEVECGVPTLDAMAGFGEIVAVRLAGGVALTLLHEGLEGSIPAAHGILDEYLEEMGLRPAGARMESHLEAAPARPRLRRTLLVQPVEE